MPLGEGGLVLTVVLVLAALPGHLCSQILHLQMLDLDFVTYIFLHFPPIFVLPLMICFGKLLFQLSSAEHGRASRNRDTLLLFVL